MPRGSEYTRLPMEKDARQSVFSVVGEMLQDGMKVIAVARKHVGTRKEITPDDEKEQSSQPTWPIITQGLSVTSLKMGLSLVSSKIRHYQGLQLVILTPGTTVSSHPQNKKGQAFTLPILIIKR